MSTFRD